MWIKNLHHRQIRCILVRLKAINLRRFDVESRSCSTTTTTRRGTTKRTVTVQRRAGRAFGDRREALILSWKSLATRRRRRTKLELCDSTESRWPRTLLLLLACVERIKRAKDSHFSFVYNNTNRLRRLVLWTTI